MKRIGAQLFGVVAGLGIAAVALGCGSVLAQPVSAPPELRAFLARRSEQKIVDAGTGKQWRELVGNCETPRTKSRKVVVEKQPAFDATGTPTAGVWRVVSNVEGCGQTRLLTILYFFTQAAELKRASLLPGTTIAGPLLQRDALLYAAAGMHKLMPRGCKDIQYLNTSFVGYGEKMPNVAPGRDARSWTEDWTVKACGVTGIVKVRFIPDATGTTISVPSSETRQVEH